MMMGRQASPARLFYDFCLNEHVPAAQWTEAHHGPAFFAYATNSLIDTDIALGLVGGNCQPRPPSSMSRHPVLFARLRWGLLAP